MLHSNTITFFKHVYLKFYIMNSKRYTTQFSAITLLKLVIILMMENFFQMKKKSNIHAIYTPDHIFVTFHVSATTHNEKKWPLQTLFPIKLRTYANVYTIKGMVNLSTYFVRSDMHCSSWYKIVALSREPQITKFMGHHVARLCPVGPRWTPCWPHEPCCQGRHCGSVATT